MWHKRDRGRLKIGSFYGFTVLRKSKAPEGRTGGPGATLNAARITLQYSVNDRQTEEETNITKQSISQFLTDHPCDGQTDRRAIACSGVPRMDAVVC